MKSKFLVMVTVATALLFAVDAVAARPFEDAVAAGQRGDYATAFRLFRPLAEAGSPDARVELGSLFSLGSAFREAAARMAIENAADTRV